MAIRGKRKQVTGKITISRPNGSDHREYISLTLKDGASNIEYVDIEIELADFAKLLTGQGYLPFSGEVRGLEFVGKEYVSENRSVVCPMHYADRKGLQEWLNTNCQEDGWFIDDYLGSQRSTSGHKDGTVLNYSVYKYVDKPE